MSLLMRGAVLLLVAFLHSCVSRTVFEFKRKLDTCDSADIPIPSQGPLTLLYAWNDKKPTSENGIAMHTHRGQKGMRLLNPRDTPLPPDATSFALVQDNENITFPARTPKTQYQCKVFALPNTVQTQPAHIVQWAPEIDPRNVDVVHHMLMYDCPALTEADVGASGGCFDGVLPNRVTACLGQTVFAAWAVGGLPYAFPPIAGLPMGPNTTKYVVLETHYSNPTMRPIVDSSGMRFWQTYTLRPHDAGILETGWFTDPSYTIPARQNASVWQGHCPSYCTARMMPPSGVNIIGVILHAHLAGRSLSLRHVRNGTELTPIGNDPLYDFNFQDIDVVEPGVPVLPGDELFTTCTYSTADREQPTHFGLSTEDEMCLAFSIYYPRIPQSVCLYGEQGPTTYNYCDKIQVSNQPRTTLGPLPTNCSHALVDPARQIPTQITSFDATGYENHDFLDADNRYAFHWSVDRVEGVIAIAIDVDTDGWVGLGFSETGAMPGSDVSIGWIGVNGSVNHRDRFAYQRALPPQDVWQDFFDIRGGTIAPTDEDTLKLTAGEKAALGIGITVMVLLAIAVGIYFFRKHKHQLHGEHTKLIGEKDDEPSTNRPPSHDQPHPVEGEGVENRRIDPYADVETS